MSGFVRRHIAMGDIFDDVESALGVGAGSVASQGVTGGTPIDSTTNSETTSLLGVNSESLSQAGVPGGGGGGGGGGQVQPTPSNPNPSPSPSPSNPLANVLPASLAPYATYIGLGAVALLAIVLLKKKKGAKGGARRRTGKSRRGRALRRRPSARRRRR